MQNKSPNSLTYREFLKFQNPPVFCLLACLPPCLPAVRLTSGKRVGLVFSCNTEYQCTNTDLLFQLCFIHCAMVSPFVLPCFPFSLTGEWKGEKSLWRGVDESFGLYLLCHTNGQMQVCLIASSIKIINKCNVFLWFKSARMISCWDLYACSWSVISQYSCC